MMYGANSSHRSWSCFQQGLPTKIVTNLVVSSYLTISPLLMTYGVRYCEYTIFYHQYGTIYMLKYPYTLVNYLSVFCIYLSNPMIYISDDFFLQASGRYNLTRLNIDLNLET